ncbi:hypothetical protein E7T06_14885 [Deinococcus sp. Arct2-2]|uniref:hypothetical protein n=1 Tax=Deinococcus sp. Arct2-2 TaxID=2568653 RepID=UPI0010A2AB89|nr:hypothetical protein [Deinococcus sp. Arct2-2]THF68748.1 hypothetical protein E7T06_14885 [Deinococcus sp. Arct2-2]
MTKNSSTEFARIAEQYRAQTSLLTRTQEAERQKDLVRVERATQLTTGGIVGTLADLQIEFNATLQSLIGKLDGEYERLEEVSRAKVVQGEYLNELSQIRVVADALYLQRVEHLEGVAALARDAQQAADALAREQAEQGKAWEEQRQAFERSTAAREAERAAAQLQETADYSYEQTRERQIERDDLKREIRDFERDHAEDRRLREKDWAEREAVLLAQGAKLEEQKAKLAAFPAELAELVSKTRAEAIEEVSREAKVKAELMDRDWEGQKRVYEYRITALDDTLSRQAGQIQSLTEQLQEVMKQAQDLALRAVTSYSQKA